MIQKLFESWRIFLKESNFLKDTHVLGYLEKKYYPEIEQTLNGLSERQDYIFEEEQLLWNFENKNLTSKINEFMFKTEVESTFDLNYLKFTREPIEINNFNFNNENFVSERVNHYMIKENNSSEFNYGELDYSDTIKKFINICYDTANEKGLEPDTRYCFLTIDHGVVKSKGTQREGGWHIDGLQGVEVQEKKSSDYQFIWADGIPTRFCTQTIDTNGLDVSKHNVFKWIQRQIKNKHCYSLERNKIYLMNAYHLHAAAKTNKTLYRKFIRVSFTNTPITSTKMTKNPNIKYNYPIGTTNGNIPTGLSEITK